MPGALKLGFYIAIFLLGYFFIKRKKPRPSKLDLSGFKNQSKSKKLGAIRKVNAEVVEEAPEMDEAHIFMHRTQKFDAYRVLQIPMGAGIKDIKTAYQLRLLEQPDSIELLGKAYEALIRK